MIAYHGSHTKGLKQLTYSEENSRFGGEAGLKHGAAIYMTISDFEAQAYATGGSYYKVQLNGYIFDATDEEVLIGFIRSFCQKHDIDEDMILNPTMQSLVKSTSIGVISAVVFAKNIEAVISNDEYLYNTIICEKFSSDSDACADSLNEMFDFTMIKLQNNSTETWILCLDPEGKGIEILEEIEINE